jgi:hypothetical protein
MTLQSLLLIVLQMLLLSMYISHSHNNPTSILSLLFLFPMTVCDGLQVSPIEYGHVLLIPRVLDRLPQMIDPESFLLALQMAAEAASPYFRLGYNSLGAFATINHLHFQVLNF